MAEEKRLLLAQMFRLFALMHRYRLQAGHGREPFGDPHRGQGRVLSILKMKPEISQKELSYLLDIRNQSLGELLAKLERSGYVTRQPSEQDRRVMMVRLTTKGEEATHHMDQMQTGEELFDCLSEKELANFGEMMGRVVQSLEEKLGEPGADGRRTGDMQDFFGHGSHRDFGGVEGFVSRKRGGFSDYRHPAGDDQEPSSPPKPNKKEE